MSNKPGKKGIIIGVKKTAHASSLPLIPSPKSNKKCPLCAFVALWLMSNKPWEKRHYHRSKNPARASPLPPDLLLYRTHLGSWIMR